MKNKLLLSVIFLCLFQGCATTTIEQLSNDKEYDIEIYNINNAHINQSNDVEICFDGRVEYKIGRHSTDREYSFVINKDSILNSINDGKKTISIPSAYIKTGCSNVSGKHFTPLEIYKVNKRSEGNISNFIDYEITINEAYTLPSSEGYMRVERYYRTEDKRFNGHHEFSLELDKIQFKGFPLFKIFYPVTFVLDLSTLPIQVMYCLTSKDNPCGIKM